MSNQKRVRLFRNGRNQAVRIPVEFELPGDEAIMHCDGDRLVIEPMRKRGRGQCATRTSVAAKSSPLNSSGAFMVLASA
jgi:virulence-associated protein VagC